MRRFVLQSAPPARAWASVGFALAASFVASPAVAAPGDHIRAGVVTIVPRVDLGVAYHSNVYRAEADPSPAVNSQVSPGVAISAGGDDHEFAVDGSWNLQKYLFVGGDQVPTGGRAARIANLDRFDAFNIGAGARLFKQNRVGLKLSDELSRKNWTIDDETAVVPYTSQLRNAANVAVRTNPAPAVELTPSVAWTYDNFQAPILADGVTGAGTRKLNSRNAIGPHLDAKWAFLPRTAIVGHFDYTYNAWSLNQYESVFATDTATSSVADTHFIKSLVGIDGRFTERIFAQAFLGFGTGIAADGSVAGSVGAVADNLRPIDGLLAKLHVKYAIVPSNEQSKGAAVSLGYVKDFRSTFYTNFVAVNSLFTEFKGQFDDFEPSLRYELRFENYDGAVDRSDLVNSLRGGVGWEPADFVRVRGGIAFVSRTSTQDPIEYKDVALDLGATFLY